MKFHVCFRAKAGGGGRIRTSVGVASRFTVCPLWPLGYPSTTCRCPTSPNFPGTISSGYVGASRRSSSPLIFPRLRGWSEGGWSRREELNLQPSDYRRRTQNSKESNCIEIQRDVKNLFSGDTGNKGSKRPQPATPAQPGYAEKIIEGNLSEDVSLKQTLSRG